jgi:predicted DNA-binding transcriptional regulator YafY
VRASRLVQLLLLLQRRGRTTAEALATELEVSVRTIYRDVEALSASGVPIYGESGPGGGIELVGGYETRLTGLTGPEATALGLAGLPDAAADLGLGSVLVAAQAKVDAAMPPELRARATRLRERFLVDAPGWFRAPEAVPALAALAGALWDGRRVEIRYRRADRVVRRRLDPLGLVLKGSVWYLVARARRPDGLRTFRVSRIVGLAVSDEPVTRPAGFDLATAWAELGAAFDRDLRRYVVHALVDGDRLALLRHALPAPSGQQAIDSAGPPRGDGRRPVVVHSESLEVAHDELLRVGRALEVVAPAELRDALAQTGRALAARHTTSGDRKHPDGEGVGVAYRAGA